MQMMTWTLGRLGSRFAFVFEPGRRRVRHGALGVGLMRPMDLAVGFVDERGEERVLPFTREGRLLEHLEQFERINSITYRGHCVDHGLRFELNLHGVFYPRDDRMCVLPAFFMELRANPDAPVAGRRAPDHVDAFIRVDVPWMDRWITPGRSDRLDIGYDVQASAFAPTTPASVDLDAPEDDRSFRCREAIVSLNRECSVLGDRSELRCRLPVTPVGSGQKWRLVWGGYCGEPVLASSEAPGRVDAGESPRTGRFRYTRYWNDLEDVLDEAIDSRDASLVRSRGFEKLIDNATLQPSQRHLLCQTFQQYLASSFWCDLSDGSDWFSLHDPNTGVHSSTPTGMYASMLPLSLWPDLLRMQLEQWAGAARVHEKSAGRVIPHDLGFSLRLGARVTNFETPLENAASFILMLQLYGHYTGDLELVRSHRETLIGVLRYLLWVDGENTGLPTRDSVSLLDDAGPAARLARRQVYLAVKRMAALHGGASLLRRDAFEPLLDQCEAAADAAAQAVEREGWLGDHFAIALDPSAAGVRDPRTGLPLGVDRMEGADGYSVLTGIGLLVPAMVGQPLMLDSERLLADLINAARETDGRYGCAHTTADDEVISVSINIWRDGLVRYLHSPVRFEDRSEQYWDLQTASNTFGESSGFTDAYVAVNRRFHPIGAVAFSWFITAPRLMVDRLSPGGQRLVVEPDRMVVQRWPLLPLADWAAGKVPVCVVDAQGRVRVEAEIDPIVIRGQSSPELIG